MIPRAYVHTRGIVDTELRGDPLRYLRAMCDREAKHHRGRTPIHTNQTRSASCLAIRARSIYCHKVSRDGVRTVGLRQPRQRE